MNKIGLSLIVILLINVLYVDNNYSNNIGYIEIDSIKIKNGIVNGISEEILNNNDIGMIRDSNIILVGNNVLEKLKKINIFDEIKIKIYDKEFLFIVHKKIELNKNDVLCFNDDLVIMTKINNKKLLVLGTKKPL